MKKLYIPLFLSLFLILSLLCGCFCLSHCAQHQVAELKKCTDTLPSAEEFDRIRKDPERTALLEEQLKNIESKTKRAEEKLALFINYNYLNTLSHFVLLPALPSVQTTKWPWKPTNALLPPSNIWKP